MSVGGYPHAFSSMGYPPDPTRPLDLERRGKSGRWNREVFTMRVEPLTVDQHRELAASINAIEDELVTILKTCSRHMPRRVYEGVTQTALKAIGRLKCRLEDRMFVEHPNLGNEGLRVYY